jgi:hypothetical protein
MTTPDLNALYAVFKAWLETKPEDVEIESAFMCLYPDGKGWIGDGAGGVYFEFDSPADGIAKMIKGHEEQP